MKSLFQNLFSNLLFGVGLVLISGCLRKKTSLPDPLLAGWKSQPVCELIEDNDEVRVLRCSFKPGVGHERHYHKEHFGYTLAGSRMRITDEKGTREITVRTGSHFYSKGIKWHEVLNIGDSTAIFLIVEPK